MNRESSSSFALRSRKRSCCLRSTALAIETVPEHEVLERLLAFSQSAVSGKALLRHFPSLGHVMAAEFSQLESFGMTAHDLSLLRLVRETARRMAQGAVRTRYSLGNWQALLSYLNVAMAQIEHFRVLFLDRKNTLISDELQNSGTVNHTPVYPREVVKRALILNASALIVAHNHPSGDPTPSRGDVEMTRQLRTAAEAVGLDLHDHVVIGHGRHVSFRSAGLL